MMRMVDARCVRVYMIWVPVERVRGVCGLGVIVSRAEHTLSWGISVGSVIFPL